MSTGAQTYFDEIVAAATSRLVGDEVLLANVAGERTDFIRLNHGDVRQAGTVDQRALPISVQHPADSRLKHRRADHDPHIHHPGGSAGQIRGDGLPGMRKTADKAGRGHPRGDVEHRQYQW